MKSYGLTIAALASFVILGACEDVDLSTGPSGTTGRTELVKFDNKSKFNLQITIAACFQDFVLDAGRERTIECNPEDGSTSFDVGIVRTDEEEANWDGPVAKGQALLILTNPWHGGFFTVEIED